MRAGLGFTIQPYGAVADEVDEGRLRAMRIVDPSITRTMVLVTSTQRGFDLPAQVLLPTLRETVSELIRTGRWVGQLPKRPTMPPTSKI